MLQKRFKPDDSFWTIKVVPSLVQKEERNTRVQRNQNAVSRLFTIL